jgi:hypothetical protein
MMALHLQNSRPQRTHERQQDRMSLNAVPGIVFQPHPVQPQLQRIPPVVYLVEGQEMLDIQSRAMVIFVGPLQ